MDYDWKYFMDDLKSGTAGHQLTDQEREVAAAIRFRMGERERAELRSIVRNMMADYRSQPEADRALFEELMKAHGEYCRLLRDEDTQRKQHNAVVYRYMIKTPLHNMAVSRKMCISNSTLSGYIRKSADDIVQLLCGSPAAGGDGKDTGGCIKGILDNLTLIRMSQGIQNRLKWEQRQQEREKYLSITADALRCLDIEISLYEDFIKGCNGSKDQERPLDALKAVYMGGGGISEIITSYGVSEGTFYADIRKMIERLAELTEYLIGRGQTDGGRTGQG